MIVGIESIELIGGIVGTVLTLLILSYIALGDNALYRLALHILVGASVGYAIAVAVVTVIIPGFLHLSQGDAMEWVLPMVLGVALLFKALPRVSTLGNFSTAFLVGVGAAVALTGALIGTIIPQATAGGSIFDWLQQSTPLISSAVGLLVALGTALALLASTFTVRKRDEGSGVGATVVDYAGRLGRIFLVAAFGATFGATLISSVSVLIGRIYALIEGIGDLVQLLMG
ncbi:MAG: hypothetical protein PVI59_01500 [Anaerolineae bacterium]|jgi:hypothetical protein